MVAVLSAIPLLTDTLIILGFFFIAFAIGGVQIMAGVLKKRCISIQTGMVHPNDLLCGSEICPGGYFCGKNNESPNYGVTNFDNLFYAILTVFQCVTLEGWSDIQSMMQRSLSYYMFLFFIPLVFIGAFFLLNLTLAVINAKFTEAHKFQQQQIKCDYVV
jgi:voltage-dependent calcium channel L type alpha-1D